MIHVLPVSMICHQGCVDVYAFMQCQNNDAFMQCRCPDQRCLTVRAMSPALPQFFSPQSCILYILLQVLLSVWRSACRGCGFSVKTLGPFDSAFIRGMNIESICGRRMPYNTSDLEHLFENDIREWIASANI